jgi:uncharacterized membrane protein
MKAQRLEAFTDGVLAIVITITVLEMKVPSAATPAALAAAAPVLLAYGLSFVNVGIFWANHHHMMQAANHISGRVLWANLSLLFWLSLVPFVIRWIDEQGLAPLPVAAYGFILFMSAVSYSLTERAIIAGEGGGSLLKEAVGRDLKGWLSILHYLLGAAVAFLLPAAAIAIYLAVSAMWLVPDSRIERRMTGP